MAQRIYCYTTEDGVTVERACPMGHAPARVFVEGKVARRDYQAEHVTVPPTAGWPMEPCVGSGVNAAQAGELREFFKKHGENVQITNDGDPIYENAAQRKRLLKLRGLHDRSSFN